MRRLLAMPSTGALPPNPRDTCRQKMTGSQGHFLSANIPAGGTDRSHPRARREGSAQNSSFKNFAGPGAPE